MLTRRDMLLGSAAAIAAAPLPLLLGELAERLMVPVLECEYAGYRYWVTDGTVINFEPIRKVDFYKLD